jgi:NTE family protein
MGGDSSLFVNSRPALVLGGGGALGVAQAAYALAAFELGFEPKIMVGTSVGSLNGAWLATNPGNPEGLLRVWLQLDRMKLLQVNPLRLARNLARGQMGISTNDLIPKLIARYVGDADFDEAAMPLAIVATNLTRGQKHVFRSGRLAPAIRASTAIPGIFEPVRIGDDVFVDGCLTASVDLLTAVEMGATEILAIDLTPLPSRTKPRTVVGVLKQSFGILTHATTDAMERSVAMQVPVRVVRPALAASSPWRLDDSAGAIAHNLLLARAHIGGVLDAHGHVVAGWAWDAAEAAPPEPAAAADDPALLSRDRFFRPSRRQAS